MIQTAAIAGVLREGGVVLLPTDTIYGLHAVAAHDAAIARLIEIKGRDADKPFVVIGASMDQLERAGARFDERARAALEQLWPAPLTAIVPLDAKLPAARGAQTIAVRVPALDWLRELLWQTGPLASTSANRSGEAPITTPESLADDLQIAIDAVVDAGPLDGKPSAIVDFTGEPRVVREGEPFFTQKMWKTLRKSL